MPSRSSHPRSSGCSRDPVVSASPTMFSAAMRTAPWARSIPSALIASRSISIRSVGRPRPGWSSWPATTTVPSSRSGAITAETVVLLSPVASAMAARVIGLLVRRASMTSASRGCAGSWFDPVVDMRPR